MRNEIRANQDHQDWGRAPDGWLDILQRHDGLIAKAEGDSPLQEFWRLSKREYQEYIEQVRVARQKTARPAGGPPARCQLAVRRG